MAFASCRSYDREHEIYVENNMIHIESEYHETKPA